MVSVIPLRFIPAFVDGLPTKAGMERSEMTVYYFPAKTYFTAPEMMSEPSAGRISRRISENS